MDGKWWKVIFFLVIGFSASGQYIYTYTDPCTGILNSVTISQPSGSVTLFYAGQYQTFTAAQLQTGAFEAWVAQINSLAPPGSNPCAGNGGSNANNNNAITGTNTATNVSGIIGIAANLGGSIGTSSAPGSGTGNNENSTSTGGSGSGENSSGGSGSETGREGTEGGTTTGGTSEGGVSEGALGGSGNTTTASGGESESGGESGGGGGQKQKNKQEKIGRGALIGAGDFVVIRNGNDITKSGRDNLRFNTSLTHVNTKQNLIKGINLNFTTGENILNTTLYGSYKTKSFMGVFSNSTMTNLKSDIFNTTTVLGTQKTGPLTLMGGTNFTIGKIGSSSFQNWSLVGGTFTTFKGFKTFSANVMALGIYSPYIFYYEGQWYRSGILLVPLANIDIKLTDKFKWSISFMGAYQWKAEILNFQLSTGTKILL
jgi:hypothetical protein